MQDGVIKEIGNSRYLRTIAGIKQLCPTYDSFLELLIKGEFPIDWFINEQGGWAQRGTPLNKANLLADATAALAGLGEEATPDQMFAVLADKIKDAVTTAKTAQSTANTAQSTANAASNKITYGTASMTDGVSDLATGTLYIKY